MNKWLTSTVGAYKTTFGYADHPVVWDVGSRDGDDGVELAERISNNPPELFWDRATVVAVEPNPEQAEIIRKNYPKMTVLELAVSDVSGSADFMVYEGDEGAVGSSSLNLGWKEDDLQGHIIRVQLERLDALMGDEMVDVMKIDVEGHSLQVLHGLGDKLQQVKVLHVETEEWTKSDKMVADYMTKQGFLLEDVMEEWGGMPDQVWVNKNIYKTRFM